MQSGKRPAEPGWGFHEKEEICFGDNSLSVPKNILTWPSLPTAAAAKSLQSCPTLCDPRDGSPPGSPVPGILQARTLEWVAIPFPMRESEKWNWSRSVVSNPQQHHGLQPSRLLHPWDFPGKSTGVGCHCLLRKRKLNIYNSNKEIRNQ